MNMEDLALAYAVNTAASLFDLTTTVALKSRDSNFKDETDHIDKSLDEIGPIRTLIKGESARRIGFAVIAALTLGGEKLFAHLTQTPEFPAYALVLYVPALLYFGAGLLNLIPLAYGKRPNVYVSQKKSRFYKK